MPDFGDSERRLLYAFRPGETFNFRGSRFRVEYSGKPTCSFGEPKTDVFARCTDMCANLRKDFKLSYKQANANFLENKISAERAYEILGPNWSELISCATKTIRSSFESRQLIYKHSYRHTEAGSITVGWKFEFLNCPSGDLSGRIPLSFEQKREIYAGTNTDLDKRNAYVCGHMIQNSGVAEYIVVSDGAETAQQVVDMMMPIENYARETDIYFACKALNLRTLQQPPKWDGNRPLAVQVDWYAQNGRLVHVLDFDNPLTRKGDEVVRKLQQAMQSLRISTTDQLTINGACY